MKVRFFRMSRQVRSRCLWRRWRYCSLRERSERCCFCWCFPPRRLQSCRLILGVLFAALVLLNRYELRMMQERENREQEALGTAEEKAHQFFHGMSFFEQHGVFAAEQKEYEGTRQKAWEAQLYKVKGHSTVELISEALIGASFTALFLSIISGAGERVVTMANMAVAISLLQSIAGNVAELLTNIKEMTGVLVPLERVSNAAGGKGADEEADFRKAPVVIRTSSSEIVIKEGEHVAVIGHNGSGKTTLLVKSREYPIRKTACLRRFTGEMRKRFPMETGGRFFPSRQRRSCCSMHPLRKIS